MNNSVATTKKFIYIVGADNICRCACHQELLYNIADVTESLLQVCGRAQKLRIPSPDRRCEHCPFVDTHDLCHPHIIKSGIQISPPNSATMRQVRTTLTCCGRP